MKRSHPLLVLAVCLALGGCAQDAATPSAVTDVSKLPADDIMFGLHHVMTTNGVRTAVLDADTAYLRESGQVFDLVGVHLQFYNDSGRQTGTLTSRTGNYDVRQGNFTAIGNVVLDTENENGPLHLETEKLTYAQSQDQLWSDVPFVMTQNGQTTRGQSFRSDTKFENWTVKGATTTGGLPEPKGGVTF
ncbi:MAG TPA: LPS export ABC transporter periplasmic protein LptC [Longimicrobiaceae bacterium]|nr:LPS export ABC transporter periplasmic protein LptC [Longimicrobiaceae bacterium]